MGNLRTTLTGPPFVVYRDKRKALLGVLFAVAMLAAAVAMEFLPVSPGASPMGRLSDAVTRYAGPPLMLFLLGLTIYTLVSKSPVLVIDDYGVTMHGIGPIAWEHIAGLQRTKVMDRDSLAMLVDDRDGVAATISPKMLRRIHQNVSFLGCAAMVGLRALPMSAAELMAAIEPYCSERIRRNAPSLAEMWDGTTETLLNPELEEAIRRVTSTPTRCASSAAMPSAS